MLSANQKHTRPTVTVLFLLLLTLSHRLSAFAVNKTDNGFEVWLENDVKIFSHTPENPMVYLGKGDIDFVESKGNFRIEDYVTSRIPLSHASFDCDSPGGNCTVKLSAAENTFVRFQLSQDGNYLIVDFLEISSSYDRLWLRLEAEEEEKVYGGGEQFSYFNLRGRDYPIWTREQGVGRNKSTLNTFYSDMDSGAGGDYHTTYFPQPTFLSSRNYSFHHNGNNYAVLDFSHETFHEIYVLGMPGRVYIAGREDPADLVMQLTDLLGRQPQLPDWISSGAILGIQGGTQKMLGYITQAEAHSIPVAGVWIQDWVGRITTSFGRRLFWDWHWREEQYPDLKEKIAELKSKGIRVLAYINPYLNREGTLFQEADAKGYFVKNATNQTFINDFGEFFCGTIDLTNPDAYQWYKNEVVKKNMIDLGFGGWMADFGEYLPTHGVYFHSGQTAEELHNIWPVLWAKLNREAVEETNNTGEIVFWMRAGYSGSGKYSTLMWAGDQNVDFSISDGIASTITAALSMGVSGVGLTHFDIGGFTTFGQYNPPLVRDEECLLRSAEMAVFTPAFRTHEGNQPSNSLQYYSSHGTLEKFARLARMFASLKNYRRHVINITASTGLPAQRPLFLHYPADPASYDVTYQYLFGRDLLVAPVYLPDVESWEVYLPPDPEAQWVFLWNETVRSSGNEKVKVSAPLGQPPVFYRSNSGFIDEFKALTSEPLVDIPEFVLPSQRQEPRSDPERVACGASKTLPFQSVLVILITIFRRL